MTYTPVIPSSYVTDRQDLNDAIEAIIDAFIVSAGYAIGRQWRSELPDTFTAEGPLIVLGDITESIAHDMQTRRTVFSGALYYIDWITDRGEVNTRINVWSDHMRDLFTANVSTVNPDAVLVQTGFAEGEFTQGQLVFAGPSVLYEYRVLQGYR